MMDFDVVNNVEFFFKVGINWFLIVNDLRVDFRDWVVFFYCIQKGIIFIFVRWKYFIYFIDEIDQVVMKFWVDDFELEMKKWYLGGNVFVIVNFEYLVVDICYFWVLEGQIELMVI